MEEFENGKMRFRAPNGHEGKTHWIHPNPTLPGPRALCRQRYLKHRSIAVGVPDSQKVTCQTCLALSARKPGRRRFS